MRLIRIPITTCLALLALAVAGASAASATGSWLCIPTKAGAAVTSGGSTGECAAETAAVEMPAPAEMKALVQVLPHISYEASGVAEKPTVRFTGVNVQIVNGEGLTSTTNGEGNLVIGYAEAPIEGEGKRTGSHNLLLGTEQEFTSYGGIIGGIHGRATAPYASVLGGISNTASGKYATVLGGVSNTASGQEASVAGGGGNTASGFLATVAGGSGNTASGEESHVGAGRENTASDSAATVDGGEGNVASGPGSWIGGGYENQGNGWYSSIAGGYKNEAAGELSSIFGGQELVTEKLFEAIP